MSSISEKHSTRAGVVSACVFIVVFLFPIITHITKPLSTRDDIGYGYFLMDNNFTHLSSGDAAHLFDTRMFYPLKNTLALGNSMLGPTIMGLPFYLVTKDPIVSTNIVMVLNYFLTYLLLYLFAYTLTGSVVGSVIGAVIFTFNPYMMSRLHPELIVFEWIPLAFLAAEKLIRRAAWRWVIVAVVAVLMLLLSSFYYFFFVALMLPLYVVLRMMMARVGPRHFLHPAVAAGLVAVGIGAFVYLRPFIAVREMYHVYRPLESLTEFSAGLPDFLFTSADSKLYGTLGHGPVARALWKNFVLVDPFEHPYEHRLFPGLVATGFFFAAPWLLVRSTRLRRDSQFIVPIAIVGIIALVLMFGPTIRIGNIFLPSLYKLVYLLPFADTLRAPSRFIVMALFSLSVVSAFVWARAGRGTWLFIAIIILLGIEYQYDFGAFTDIAAETKALYQRLDQMPDIRTIIEVPMANGTVGSLFMDRTDIEDAIYLYNAIYHHKKLVNGYGGYIPEEFHKIGLSVDSEFPSIQKLRDLRARDVDVVVLHLDEYAYRSYGDVAVRGFDKLGVPEIARTDNIRVYRIR